MSAVGLRRVPQGAITSALNTSPTCSTNAWLLAACSGVFVAHGLFEAFSAPEA